MNSASYIPNDFRALASNQQGDFNVGDSLQQTFAIIYARNGNHIENVQSVLDIASSLQTFYDTTTNPVCKNGTLSLEENDLSEYSIYPNHAKDQFEGFWNTQQFVWFNRQDFRTLWEIIAPIEHFKKFT